MLVSRWSILAILFLVRTAMGLQFQTVGSLGPVLVDDLAIGYAGFGALIGLYLLPGIVIALPGGMLGDRFGPKQVLLAGLGLMVAGGVLMGVSASFVGLAIGRVLSGTGAILMNVVVTRMVADWFAGREIRTAMAILVASWPLGIALGLVVFAPLAAWLGWQAVMFAAVLMSALMGVLGWTLYQDPPQAPAQTSARFALELTGREWRLVLIAGFIWGFYNVGYIVLISFLPALFSAQGYTVAETTGLVSLLGWALIVLVPVGGYLADRFGRADALMLAGLAVTAVGVLLTPSPQTMALGYVLVLLAAGLPAGAIMALPASALRAEMRGSGTGVYLAGSYALMTVFPALAGFARDVTQSAAAPMWFAAAMLLAAALGLAGFRLVFRAVPDAANNAAIGRDLR